MEVIMNVAERMGEHIMIQFVERWIEPMIEKHWIVFLIVVALAFSLTVIGWYRKRAL